MVNEPGVYDPFGFILNSFLYSIMDKYPRIVRDTINKSIFKM